MPPRSADVVEGEVAGQPCPDPLEVCLFPDPQATEPDLARTPKFRLFLRMEQGQDLRRRLRCGDALHVDAERTTRGRDHHHGVGMREGEVQVRVVQDDGAPVRRPAPGTGCTADTNLTSIGAELTRQHPPQEGVGSDVPSAAYRIHEPGGSLALSRTHQAMVTVAHDDRLDVEAAHRDGDRSRHPWCTTRIRHLHPAGSRATRSE
jgi:hypothetical protein